ncbi:MAG: M14 family metallopeptidase, partial [Chloroflexota bacterium]|nr:M14 family metallopeptidase [Chloroflexota bacterium]
MTAPTPTPLPARGAKRETSLTVPGGAADGGTLTVPLLLAQGVHAGPRVAVLGGIHGDEYEGIAAAGAVWRDLSPENLRGSVAVVPVCNPLAYAAGARSTPQDGQNLARVFPGRPDGSPTEGIAHALSEAVIRQCDFLIDLHGAGQHYAMPLLCGIYVGPDALGQRCAAAALAFGAPVFWGHPEVAPGRSLSVALDAGIPCLYAECGGGGRVRPQHLQDYRAGVQ